MDRSIKFSESYDKDEDRILIVAEAASGEITRLWLTQRLSNLIVAALTDLLEKGEGRDVQADHQAIVQSWEQAAAVAQMQVSPPVVAMGDTSDALIRTVNIKVGDQGYLLTLAGTKTSVVMGLTNAELRQWCSALHGHYVAAGWSRAKWPIWITRPMSTSQGLVSTAIN